MGKSIVSAAAGVVKPEERRADPVAESGDTEEREEEVPVHRTPSDL